MANKKGSSHAKGKVSFYAYNNPGIRKVRRKAGLPPLHGREGERTCLRCSKRFQSLDVRKFRICDHCKGSSTWRDGEARHVPMMLWSKKKVRQNLAATKKGNE